jgi:hypothetical protein
MKRRQKAEQKAKEKEEKEAAKPVQPVKKAAAAAEEEEEIDPTVSLEAYTTNIDLKKLVVFKNLDLIVN